MAEQRRRGLSQLEATPVVTNKPRPVNRAAPVQRPFWWHFTPAGIRNNVAFEKKRWNAIVQSDPQRQPGQGQGFRLIGPFGSVWEFGGGKPRVLTPTLPQRDLARGAAQLPVNALRLQETLVTRGRNAAQALLTGGVPGAVQAAMQPVDTATTPGGRFLSAVERALDAATLMPDPLTRKPDELMYQGLGENLAAGIVGAGIAQKVVGANAFTQGAAKNLAPWAQQALRWTAGTGTESVIATPLVDNTKGNLANAFGENAPFAVQPTDDPLSATAKSFVPNALGEITVAGAFLGAGKSLGAIGRRLSSGREVQEVANARNWSVENGLQAEADGKFDFPAQQQAPPPEAPKTMADAEAQLLGTEPTSQPIPSQEMAPGGAVTDGQLPTADPAVNPWYDPSLPEVDTAVRAVQRLDDERLQAAISGQGPVLPELEKQLTEQQSNFQLQEGLELGMVSANPNVLAKPMVPYEDQWAQLPTDTLLSLAHPSNGSDLFGAVSRLTGREFGQFTRGDVLEGLSQMSKNGQTLLPNRVQEGSLLYDVNAIQVAPEVFQFKGNTDAQGRQIGNSLTGVDFWNTDAEGAIQIWTNPQDGLPYVVNGHNRLAKAKELGIPTIRAEELLAKTPEQARAQGAISNIAQGGGTPFDAAKFIREAGIQDAAGLEAAGIPLNSGTGAQGLALSKLPDNLFQAAVNGELPMGRALALGGSGLDPEGMTRVYQLAQGREMTDRTFAELTQMASTAPKVESDQMGLFGPEVIDTTVMKADLAGRIRAELTSNKNLFRKVGRNKSATALQEKAGTTVDQGAAADAASTAEAVLTDFDQTKYAADTPISQILNEGAAEIAAGAKPAVVARRILQQLEVAAEQSPPAPVAKAPAPVEAPAAEPAGLSPQQRTELQKQVIQRAIDNGEVRPSETPIPELPPGPRDLNDPVKTLEDEIRLAGEYGAEDALRAQAELDAKREQMGWDRMSLEEKKANGMLDGWNPRDTRGQNRYFHGASGEINLREGGEFEGDGMNIYGDGFYATDDLTTANKYQKKNAVKGQDGITYEVTEKKPIKFFDLDKPASEEVLDLLRQNGGYDSMRELIDTAIDEAGSGASLAQVMDEMRGYSREFNIPAYEIQDAWHAFTWDLEKQGYGGFTHVGGNKAGRGKRNHQVRIYWNPANSIELKPVGAPAAPGAAAAIEIPAAASRKITAKTDDSRIISAAESLASWLSEPPNPPMSLDKALEIVRAKGAILDPDKIPGLDMEAARSNQAMGRAVPEVAAAYRQFYGVDAPAGRTARLSRQFDPSSVESRKLSIDLARANGPIKSIWDEMTRTEYGRALAEVVTNMDDLTDADAALIRGADTYKGYYGDSLMTLGQSGPKNSLESELMGLVGRIAGGDLKMDITDGIWANAGLEAYGLDGSGQYVNVGGVMSADLSELTGDLLLVARNAASEPGLTVPVHRLTQVAVHEAVHRLQKRFMTTDQIDYTLSPEAVDYFRAEAAKAYGVGYDKLLPIELQAWGTQRYLAARLLDEMAAGFERAGNTRVATAIRRTAKKKLGEYGVQAPSRLQEALRPLVEVFERVRNWRVFGKFALTSELPAPLLEAHGKLYNAAMTLGRDKPGGNFTLRLNAPIATPMPARLQAFLDDVYGGYISSQRPRFGDLSHQIDVEKLNFSDDVSAALSAFDRAGIERPLGRDLSPEARKGYQKGDFEPVARDLAQIIDQRVADLDTQVAALKAQASTGGC